jgi:transcription factor IIIB subunit 2
LPSTKGDDDKDEANLYTIGMDDDKSDGEGTLGVIVEEESGTVALKPASEPAKPRKNGLALDDMDAEGEIDEGSDDDKDDDIGWEDAYEQEV